MKTWITVLCAVVLLAGCAKKEVLNNKTAEDGPSCEACADCCASEVETPSKVTETSKEAQEKTPTKVPNREVSIDELEKREGAWYAKGEAEPFTGTEIGYYEDGSKSWEVPLVDGKTQGTRIEYYKDGPKKREIPCVDGKRHGLQTSWYENGQKKEERTYEYGKMISATAWKPNGEKCPVTNVVNGNGITCRYYDNGQKWYEFNYKDGKLHGLGTSWYENGQKRWEETYKDGKQHGLRTVWYPNGQKSSETTYKDGKFISVKRWGEDGNPE